MEVYPLFDRVRGRANILSPAPDGEPMILLAIDDISRRSRMEASLRESDESFRTLFDLGSGRRVFL